MEGIRSFSRVGHLEEFDENGASVGVYPGGVLAINGIADIGSRREFSELILKGPLQHHKLFPPNVGVRRKLGIGLVLNNGRRAGLFLSHPVQHEAIHTVGWRRNILGRIEIRCGKQFEIGIDLHIDDGLDVMSFF